MPATADHQAPRAVRRVERRMKFLEPDHPEKTAEGGFFHIRRATVARYHWLRPIAPLFRAKAWP